jgi:hypothetical protein
MAWDSSRTVPWRRLFREWLIYVVVAGAAITIFTLARDDRLSLGTISGLLASGPLYVLFGAILAKFGYARKTFKDLRAERPAVEAAKVSNSASAVARTRPAPTRRTSTGPSQHRKGNKPKRR